MSESRAEGPASVLLLFSFQGGFNPGVQSYSPGLLAPTCSDPWGPAGCRLKGAT